MIEVLVVAAVWLVGGVLTCIAWARLPRPESPEPTSFIESVLPAALDWHDAHKEAP